MSSELFTFYVWRYLCVKMKIKLIYSFYFFFFFLSKDRVKNVITSSLEREQKSETYINIFTPLSTKRSIMALSWLIRYDKAISGNNVVPPR